MLILKYSNSLIFNIKVYFINNDSIRYYHLSLISGSKHGKLGLKRKQHESSKYTHIKYVMLQQETISKHLFTNLKCSHGLYCEFLQCIWKLLSSILWYKLITKRILSNFDKNEKTYLGRMRVENVPNRNVWQKTHFINSM